MKIKNIKELFKKIIPLNYHVFFFIFFCIFWSIAEFDPQTSIDGGLIISGEVIFPDDFKNVTSIYFNGWNTLHQINAILIKLNINQNLISFLIVYLSSFALLMGLYLFVYSFTNLKLISVLCAFTILITQKHFGHVDYPTLMTSEHSYGLLSFSFFTLIVGNLASKNYFIVGFLVTILMGFHLVAGVWVLCLLFLLYLIQVIFIKQLKINCFKEIFQGFSFGFIFILFSFLYFIINTIPKEAFNTEFFDIYMTYWDHHRNIDHIHINYILKTFIMVLICSACVYSQRNFKYSENISLYFLISHSLIGTIIYLVTKFFSFYLPDIFIRAMPTRLIGLHSILGYLVCFSVFIKIFQQITKKYNINTLYFYIPFSVILISYYSFFHHEKNVLTRIHEKIDQKITSRIVKFKKNTFAKTDQEEIKFWKNVKNLNTKGYIVTNGQTTNITLRQGLKPYIINAAFIDHLPYHPYTIDDTKKIIEKVYGLDFFNPPDLYRGAIKDEWYKEIFEKRKKDKWTEISKEFNLSGIILPKDWKISLKETFSSNKYSLYLF